MKLSFYDLYRLNWEKVLRPESILFDTFNNQQKTERLNNLIKLISFSRPDIHPRPIDTNVLFFKSMNRADYNEQFSQIQKLNSDSSLLDLRYKNAPQRRKYPFYIIFKYFPLLLFTNIRFNSLKRIIYLIACQIKYLEVAEKTYKNNFNFLVVHADMQPTENMLCQIAKKKNIKTVTLQHGLYVDYKNDFNINVVNYENQVANYFLAWGDDTRQLIRKYHTNTNVVICGKPLKPLDFISTKNYFTVIFDQQLFHEYNIQLLEIAYTIAKKLKIKINLRLHPSNNINTYRLEEGIVIFDTNIYDSQFVIGHTSSLLFELMRLGIPSYKFRSKIPSNHIDEDFIFSDVEELSAKIIKHTESNFIFSKYAKRYITYIGEDSLQQYRNFFKRLKNGKI